MPKLEIRKDEIKDGRGIYLNTRKGELYEGEWLDNKKIGRGRLLTKDGQQYIGEFKNDKKHGHGKQIEANSDWYEGDFVKNQRHGFGTYYDGAAKYSRPVEYKKDILLRYLDEMVIGRRDSGSHVKVY